MKRAIELINRSASYIKFPSNTPFHGLEVSFSGTADTSKYSVAFAPIPGQQGEPDIAVVEIRNISFHLNIYLIYLVKDRPMSTKIVLMSTKTVCYPNITARFSIDGKKVTLVADTASGQWGDDDDHWPSMPTLPNGNPFTQELKDDWRVQEAAFKLISKDEFGASFVQSIEIPDILGMVNAFTFTGPIRVSGTPELIMFSGVGEWIIDCPRRRSNPALGSALRIETSAGLVSVDDLVGLTGQSPLTAGMPEDSPDSSYPPDLNSGKLRTCPKITESTFERVKYRFTTERSYHMLWW